jgi:hypothetical protein
VTPVAHIVVIGCIEPVDQRPGQASDSKYKLVRAKSGKNDSTPTTGTSGSASQAQTATTYRLDNAKNSMLAQDVGHQVEIVAVIEPESAASGSSAAATEPTLQVETVRVISPSCPQ